MPTPDRFSELRVLRWFDRIDAAIAGETVGPIRANIDLENACQDKCPWCEPADFRALTIADRNHTLSYAVVLEVLHDLKELDCKTINLSGGGEPTLHPQFGLILRAIANMGFRSWIVTNGGRMHKWLDELLLADHVRVSLDASNAQEHQEMHGSRAGEFEKVCANIVELCRGRVNGSPEVGIAYIVADVNDFTASYERVFSFASTHGVDFIHFRPLSEESPKRFTSDWEQVTIQLNAIAENYPKVQCFPLAKRSRDVFNQRSFESCYSALTNAVISANGEVCACCDRRDIVFGDVNQQSFKSIWLAAKHRKAAEAIVPKFCARCLQCSFNRSVERYIVNNEALPELL